MNKPFFKICCMIEIYFTNIEVSKLIEAVSKVVNYVFLALVNLSVYFVVLCGSITYIYHKDAQRFAQRRTKHF